MQRKRIWSLVLLTAYALAFLHNLVPHHHSEESGHLHLHHSHEAGTATDHQHIKHANHLDEGVLDLLACWFSDVQHPGGEGYPEYHAPLSSETMGPKALEQAVALIPNVAVATAPIKLTSNTFEVAEVHIASHKLATHTGLRAPPVYS